MDPISLDVLLQKSHHCLHFIYSSTRWWKIKSQKSKKGHHKFFSVFQFQTILGGGKNWYLAGWGAPNTITMALLCCFVTGHVSEEYGSVDRTGNILNLVLTVWVFIVILDDVEGTKYLTYLSTSAFNSRLLVQSIAQAATVSNCFSFFYIPQ